MNKALNIFNRIIAGCLMLAAVVVLVVSTFTTIYYDMHIDVDFPQYGKENIPLLAVLVAAVFLVFWLIYRAKGFQKSYIFLGLMLCFVTAYCLTLIFSIRPLPVDDSLFLDNAINDFMDGDYSSLTSGGGYLNTWPFQLGYVAFGQIMVSIFGKSNYFAWDIVQLFCILITIYLIYKITWELFEDEEVCGIVALLSMGALFFYNYVTYIYGDILSMAPQTLALYMMVLYVKREKDGYALISAISIALAVLLKTNSEVTLIALVMILIGSAFRSNCQKVDGENGEGTAADGNATVIKTKSNLPRRLVNRIILAVIMVLITFGAKAGVDAYYCHLTGLQEIPGGSPAWSHIAMGLQESELEDGWYNGYNYQVFGENGYDTEKTAEVAKANIMETLTDFAHRPLHACRFFLRKFTTQWADSVCISTHNLDLVSRHVENQPWLCDYLVFGQGSQVLIWVMNVFMSVCYLGVAIYLFQILVRRHATTEEMLILILIFGGIVFHEFWEGASRYTMRYYIYWLPYAAYGIKKLVKR
ncbi:glycosyltransferase family 39 protein [Butyrivibrio sp. AE2032]|uniref:glycosyltransferase family 39 protein n=1 Tax=Butyrivibrio sp. AE2032 TaxID=1458463 RepID=UPI000550AF57|nr:glycosyltransferase family 39 protein [Butyrivibrio sp. AE2032]